MGWFWASNENTVPAKEVETKHEGDISMCPVMHNENDNKKDKDKDKDKGTDSSYFKGLNPLNYMPKDLSPTQKQPGQKLDLTTNKTVSTIPRGNEKSNWEYPSAQQMYNAMIRKGKINQNDGLQEDTVEAMVQIHNFLNESCWLEILRWEKPYTDKSNLQPKLLKFMGKPGILTPRARYHHYLSYIFPWYFQKELPFDRHDWVVLRGINNGADIKGAANTKMEAKYIPVRYVLDFYGGPDDKNGMPTFSVDVRPALDNFGNVKDRMIHFTSNIWGKMFGRDKSKS